MPKLVLIEGKPYSGKTTLSRYIEQELGFRRISTEHYVSILQKAAKVSFSSIVYQIRYNSDDIFWKNFWEQREGKYPDFTTARELAVHYSTRIGERVHVPANDRLRMAYGFWNSCIDERDAYLFGSQNVVMDSFVSKAVTETLLKVVDVNRDDIDKFLVRLVVSDETSIKRQIKEGFSIESARRKTRMGIYSGKFSSPGLVVLSYKNETQTDLERIKTELKERFDKS